MADLKVKKLSIQSFGRKAGRMMLIFMSIFFAVILILVGVLQSWSYPGKPQPIVDEKGKALPGNLSEKIFLDINGVKQGMFIKSKDRMNPVLLFLHGGPGMPEYFLTEHYPTHLEDFFTVVWWDQRGAGLSYHPGLPRETMTYDQLIADTVEVTKYLRQRFGKEKIYLMAHSGGTFLGIQVAARAPELYYAYIGVAQVSYQLASERLAYEYALEEYQKKGNTNMLRKLEAAPPTMTVPLPTAYDALRDPYMHDLGVGTTRDMKSIVTGVFVPSWQSREYTLSEKINLWRGKIFSASMLRNQAFSTDLTKQVTELKIPIYFFSGIFDYTVNYTLAKDYFENIQAPVKGFYTFEQSAHSPMFEEPEKVLRIMQQDVLTGKNDLADR